MASHHSLELQDPFQESELRAAIHAPSKLLAETLAARALGHEEGEQVAGVRSRPDPDEEWPTVRLRPDHRRPEAADPTAAHPAVHPDEWPTDVVRPKKAAK